MANIGKAIKEDMQKHNKGVKNKSESLSNDLLYLRLRNAIADKEWITSCANAQIMQVGHWSCDWSIGIKQADDEIKEILKQLEI